MSTQTTGQAAEKQARHYLENQGLRLRARNYRSRFGEIDLIMVDGDTLVFVEVRLRTHTSYGGGLSSVDTRKQRKLARTALAYLQQHRLNDAYCRFDVIAVHPQGTTTFEWIRNAFDYTG